LPDYSWNPELKELALTIQREIINENPNVRFNDIVGLDEAKRLLKEAVLMPLKYPHLF
jgi:katanin p60 ATPase-containing subunit A1